MARPARRELIMENILLAARHALLAKHQEQLPARPLVLNLALILAYGYSDGDGST